MTANRSGTLWAALCILGMLAAPASQAVEPKIAKLIADGNTAYAAGEYETALAAYDQAEVDCPECAEVAYNKALVHYRMRDFEKARELFNTALATRDLDLEGRCKFNLGNVSYSQALEKLANLEEAIESARGAINHYRDALELNPEDKDARANIEIAQLLIKDLLDKQKQEQEQQKEEGEQGEQGEQQEGEQQEQDDSEQQQQEGQEEQEEGQQGEDEQQQGEQEQQQEAQAEQEEGEEQQAQQGQERKMTQEEAERILQAVRDKEAKRREEKARRINVRRPPVSKDW